jgi:hypothetical protein
MIDSPEPVRVEPSARVPSPSLPPVLRGVLPPPPPGGAGHYGRIRPWLFLLFLIIFVISGAVVIGLGVWLIPRRPPTAIGALIGLAPACYFCRSRLRELDVRGFIGWLLLGGIGGAALGELAGQLIFHIDPGAPTSAGWLILGALGIGGACGVIAALIVNSGIMTILGARLMWRTWYLFMRRAA